MSFSLSRLVAINGIVLPILIGYYSHNVSCLNDSKDLVLTQAEKMALEKFKPVVMDSLRESFMKNDFYLIRWLRRAKLDIQTARNLLLQNVKWRAANNITNILKEDFSDLQSDYHMYFNGHDKMGRPILFINYGDWDLRAAVLQGKSRRLQRYLTMTLEKTIQLIFEEQKKGNYVTRGLIIGLAVLVNWVTETVTYYPDFTDETILINVPTPGHVVLNAARAVMSPELDSQIRTFDTNKKVWMEYLNKKIDKSQRSARYGGTNLNLD